MTNIFSAMLRAGRPLLSQNFRAFHAQVRVLAQLSAKRPIFEKMIISLLLLLLFSSKTEAQSDSEPFLKLLNPATVTLTAKEQVIFNSLDNEGSPTSKWHVQVNPIQNYLQDQFLTIQEPEGIGTITFTADYVTSKSNGEYYWAGANLDGSTIRIGKYPSGFLGDVYIAATGTMYSLVNLSPTKTALVKYSNWDIVNVEECANAPTEDEESESEVGDRSGCEDNNIRVLVLFTAGAAATAFTPTTVGPAVIAELNASTAASGLLATDIRFTLANVLLLPGFVETPSDIAGDVTSLTNNPAANAMRDANYADIVILLTANVYPGVSGRAKGISTLNQNAYCITEIRAASTSFTGSHEIGHVIGARHQRCSTCANSCDPSPSNNHGFSVGTTMGTIMYSAAPCGKTRIGRWSSETATFMGLQTGNWFNDNAKKLKKRADNVSCFRGTPSGPPYVDNGVYIGGSHYVCDGDDEQTYTVSYNPSAFVPTVSFTWEYSENGIVWYLMGCNATQCVLTGINNLPNVYYVRVTVTDITGFSVEETLQVTKQNCLGGGDGDRNSDKYSGQTNFEFRAYPNPVGDYLTLENVDKESTVKLSDLNGRVVIATKVSTNQQVLDLREVHSGLYILTINNGLLQTETKIVKL